MIRTRNYFSSNKVYILDSKNLINSIKMNLDSDLNQPKDFISGGGAAQPLHKWYIILFTEMCR